MLEHWNNTVDSLAEFQDIFTEFLQGIRLSPAQYKESLKVRRAWDTAQKNVNEFDNFVSPVKAIYVKLPDASKEFIDTWEYYKAYLQEQHGIIMRSRYELKALELLWEISDKDAKEAIKILNFTMHRGYARFFKPNENKVPVDNQTQNEEYDPHFNRK